MLIPLKNMIAVSG